MSCPSSCLTDFLPLGILSATLEAQGVQVLLCLDPSKTLGLIADARQIQTTTPGFRQQSRT